MKYFIMFQMALLLTGMFFHLKELSKSDYPIVKKTWAAHAVCGLMLEIILVIWAIIVLTH